MHLTQIAGEKMQKVVSKLAEDKGSRRVVRKVQELLTEHRAPARCQSHHRPSAGKRGND